jgi:hypothetical protein
MMLLILLLITSYGLDEDPSRVFCRVTTALFICGFALGLTMLFEVFMLTEAFVWNFYYIWFLLFDLELFKAMKLSSSLVTGAGS